MKNEGYVSLEQGDIFFRISDGEPEFPILFIHGAGGDSRLFVKLLDGLEGKKLSYALDLPGHGKSYAEDAPSLSAFVNSVIGFVRTMGLSNIVLAGHSMGSGILFELFTAMRDKIAGMIFISAGAVMPVNKMIFDLIDSNFSGFCDLTAQFSLSEAADDDIKTIMREGMISVGAVTVKNDFRICEGYDYRDLMKEVNIPVLILANEKDKMVSGKLIQELHEGIFSSKLIRYPLKGHMPHWENSDQMKNDIIDFVLSLVPASNDEINT
jgi:pimeloyl-ACP methyl ester carboxylesterase